MNVTTDALDTFAIYNGSRFDRYVKARSIREANEYAQSLYEDGAAEALNMRNRFGEDRFGRSILTALSVEYLRQLAG